MAAGRVALAALLAALASAGAPAQASAAGDVNQAGGLKLGSVRRPSYERPDEAYREAFLHAIENDEEMLALADDVKRRFSQPGARIAKKAARPAK
mmetsp:Transcript_51469/g.156431  ORF Transcript_51469/g.156431 Transcript_51469/m.156431 type:complete len:95 (-) Transcript_51469:39-323(-)